MFLMFCQYGYVSQTRDLLFALQAIKEKFGSTRVISEASY